MIEITPYLPGILAAYAILLVGSSSPGPSVAMLLGIATGQGRVPALIATLGIALGSMTINLLTMLGVGLLLSQAAWVISLLRFIGAAYLLYLAYGAFSKAINPPILQSMDLNYRTPLMNFMKGYLVQVTNPKAFTFWLAVASIGAVEGAGAGIILLFVTGAFLISFICHGAWAVAMSADSILVAYKAARKWIEVTLGCFFAFAAYKLTTTEN